MFTRLVGESFVRNPRRKILTAAALVVGMAVATATLTVALEVGDRLAREFRSLGANLLVTPQSDSLPLEIGGVDYRPVDEGAYLPEADLGKLKTIFWRHNILGIYAVSRRAGFDSHFGAGRLEREQRFGHDDWHVVSAQRAGSRRYEFQDGPQRDASVVENSGYMVSRGRERVRAGRGVRCAASRGAAGKTIYMSAQNTPGGAAQAISLVVTGIVSTGDAEDNAILVPLSVAQAMSGHAGRFRQLFVSALTKPADGLSERDPKSLTPTEYDRWFCSPYISSISYQIEQVLPGTDVRAIRRVADTEGRILSHVSTLLWIVTLAALIAAALAVAATSATTVLQRRAEIGIMKAIGATNALVGGIFLAEQLMLAFAGGAVGFVFGALLARVLGASVFGSPASPRLVLLPVVLGLAAIVAVVGSLIPLRRAAHFNPAPILRGE